MADLAMKFVAKELSNVRNLEENMQVLKQKIELLNSREADVLTELQGAMLISGKKRKREVENWLKNVDEKRRLFEGLGQKLEQTRSYNLVARLRLAKQVVQEIDEVIELIKQGRFPEGIVLDVVGKENVPLVTSRVKGVGFEKNLEKIWAWLIDDEVLRMGIYGMGGVGKTTLALHVHNKLLYEPKFSGGVYWVTVSQEFNSFKLQEDIGRAINIDFLGEDDENKRAATLFQALSKMEKFVLILDDLWKDFDVKKIGLPSRRDGCRLLVTSRFADVCQRIGCQKLMKVEELLESEAWELFHEELGRTMFAQEIEEIAQKVVKKICGLPLGIITMARSMRGVTDIREWKDALVELKECMARGSMGSEVLPILLCSFNRLGNPKLQQCFLYCSLYPEDYEIHRDELINMFILEELMDSRSRRQEDFDQGHVILNKLENNCMLIRSQKEGKECVKMHDLMREMALWITSDDPRFLGKPTNPRFMVKAGLQLDEIPLEMKYWKQDLVKVSLVRNQITDIPAGTSPKCPSLTTLILKQNPLGKIPESFFVHMHSLKILNLSETNIVQIPKSISDLLNMKALLLRDCIRLVSLPSLKKLKELRELDLGFTNIKEVIDGMESLVNLKCLNLDGASMEMLPPGTIRKLSRLQRLIFPVGADVAVEEVEGLRSLEEFRGVFYSMCDLKKFIKSQCGKQLSIYDIGLRAGNKPYEFGDTIRLFLKKATFKKSSLKEIGREDGIMLPWNIEVLSIESCEDMECIMSLSSNEELMQEISGLLLENLENLQLVKLPKLVDIVRWEVGADKIPPPGTLSRLKKLDIFECKRIKTLLPWGLVDNLRKLEELRVELCDELEEIIGKDEGIHRNTNFLTLPRLKVLYIFHLPKLKSVISTTIICNSIETIEIQNCRKLKTIIKWEPITTLGHLPPGNLSQLKKLDIFNCKSIKRLLPWGLAGNLQNLEELEVSLCEKLEEIIGDEEGMQSDTNVITFPRLAYLHLLDLPELKGVINTSTIICDSIEIIKIKNCRKLKTIIKWEPTTTIRHPPPSTLSRLKMLYISNCESIKKIIPWTLAGNLQNLEQLEVSSCEHLEEIIGDDEGTQSDSIGITLPQLTCLYLLDLPELKSINIFSTRLVPGAGGGHSSNLSNLRGLTIHCCDSIKTLFPRCLVGNLQNLDHLEIYACRKMEEIIGEDPEGIYNGTDVFLPQLTVLLLRNLPELKSISMSTTICVSIEVICIKKCKKLKKIPLFRGQSAPKTLEIIAILGEEREWWGSLEWDNLDIRNALQPFIRYEDFILMDDEFVECDSFLLPEDEEFLGDDNDEPTDYEDCKDDDLLPDE